MIAGADAVLGELVGEAVGACLELGVGQPALTADERLAVRDRVGDALPEVGEVELHGASQSSQSEEPDQKKSVPPSTGIVAPTTKLDSSEQRNTTTAATSSGSPTRPMSFYGAVVAGDGLVRGFERAFGQAGEVGARRGTTPASATSPCPVRPCSR